MSRRRDGNLFSRTRSALVWSTLVSISPFRRLAAPARLKRFAITLTLGVMETERQEQQRARAVLGSSRVSKSFSPDSYFFFFFFYIFF